MIPAHDHPGRPPAARPALAAHPALAASAAIPRPRRRAPHRARPGLYGRDHLHGPHLHPLGAAAGRRVRLRQRDHLLATLRRVGPRWVFERLQELLLDELARPVSWTGRGSAWTRSAYGRSGGDLCGANPVDRAKPGSKLHLAVEGGGLPLSLLVTAANTNDSLVFEALLDDLPPVPPLPAAGAAARQGARRQGL